MIFFLAQFLKFYDLAFPIKKIVLNSKSLLNPWMTKGLLKKNEIIYKNYKNLFEKTKKHLKKCIMRRC
jgi:hypothetical protein